jgi:hypothetical protein
MFDYITSPRDLKRQGVFFCFYQYYVPNGTVPEGQNIGSMQVVCRSISPVEDEISICRTLLKKNINSLRFRTLITKIYIKHSLNKDKSSKYLKTDWNWFNMSLDFLKKSIEKLKHQCFLHPASFLAWIIELRSDRLLFELWYTCISFTQKTYLQLYSFTSWKLIEFAWF